jgi:hypothetical protein
MVPENGAAVLRSASLSERRAYHEIGHLVAALQLSAFRQPTWVVRSDVQLTAPHKNWAKLTGN